MSLHFHPLRVRAVRPETDEAVVLSLAVPPELASTFAFQPGQYLTLRATVGGQDLRRAYSICSGLGEEAGVLRVGVRRVPGGVFSTWVNTVLKPGDVLQAFPPQGHFGLPLASPAPQIQAPQHVLGVAGGSGITPILSIMKTMLAAEPHSRFTLLYGNRSQKSTMFKEELEDLKNRYLTRVALHPVFSQEHMDSPLNSGRLNQAKLAEFLGPLIDPAGISHAFICGPFGLNDEAEAALKAAGVPPERIHVERFGVPGAPSAADAARQHAAQPGDADDARVVLIRDGVQREIRFGPQDASILDAAANAGMELPFSCKSGVCSTCRAKVLEGQVRMDRNFALEPHEVAAGFVLTCQAHALTQRVLLSFDER